MNRRRLLAAAAGCVVGCSGVTARSFRITAFDAAVRVTPPESRWGLEVVGRTETPPDGETTSLSRVPSAVASRLRAAADGETGLPTVSPALQRTVDRSDWITGFDDGVTRSFQLVPLTPGDRPPIRVSIRLTDAVIAPGSPGELVGVAVNRSSHGQVVQAAYHPPFGIPYLDGDRGRGLSLYPADTPPTHLLQQPRAIPTPGSNTPYEPGRRVERRYELRAGDLDVEPGEYTADGGFAYATDAPRLRTAGGDRRWVHTAATAGQWTVEWTIDVHVESGV